MAKKAEPKKAEDSPLREFLEAREAHHLDQAKAAKHTADSYRRACVKDKAVQLALQEGWHKAEARELRKMIDELE